MQTIPLQAIPNQSFSIVLDNNSWSLTIKDTNGSTSVSFILNNEVVIKNTRAVANQLIIPAKYQESGNFIFLTQNYELPIYTQFGTSQSLVYLSASELAALRVKPTTIITANDFNPNGALPIRFNPSGKGYAEGGFTLQEDSTFKMVLEGGAGFVILE